MKATSPKKKAFKEKIITYYDSIFQGDNLNDQMPNMWAEFFLLKVNVPYLEDLINSLGPDELLKIKDNINELCSRCTSVLKEDHQIKIVNGLQTLCTLFKCVFQKKFTDFGYDVINVLVGFEEAENFMQQLIDSLCHFLVADYSVSLKNLVLKLLLILVTAVDNVSANTLMEYFMMNNIFDSIVQILGNPALRGDHGHEAILLLIILVNYRKNEFQNPYLSKLSILDDEFALNGLGLVISDVLSNSNNEFVKKKSLEEPPSGFFSSITSFVGNMFVGDDIHQPSMRSKNDAILLGLYEAVITNRNFFTVLSHVMSSTKDNSDGGGKTPVIERTVPVHVEKLDEQYNDDVQSANLMATFLHFSSISLQDTKSEEGVKTAKLCLIILNSIAEDQYANAFLHDANMAFNVPIYKINLYHRKVDLEAPVSRPLACVLLDLMVEFCVTHMMKQFPNDLYRRCVGIIHKCLCYQKRCRIRLQYCWKNLWTALMNLLKFIISHETVLIPKYNVFDLAIQIVNIFNLFITYGDTFLPSPTSYDELYYEIIRVHQIFDNLYSLALRYISSDNELKVSANKLSSCLVNVRAIIHHFAPKIDNWSQENGKSSLTETEVLDVIRGNYETLTLKLMEGLDSYARYCEQPQEGSFFTQLVRGIIHRVRGSINIANLQQSSVLEEFSTIT